MRGARLSGYAVSETSWPPAGTRATGRKTYYCQGFPGAPHRGAVTQDWDFVPLARICVASKLSQLQPGGSRQLCHDPGRPRCSMTLAFHLTHPLKSKQGQETMKAFCK